MPASPLTPYQQLLLDEARARQPGPPPAPWRTGVGILAGGIVAAGWGAADRLVLVSHAGYSVIEPLTGRRLVRDRDVARTWAALGDGNLSFTVPATSERIPMFGLWGGDGRHTTEDGWWVEVIYPWWPLPQVVLGAPSPPGEHDYLDGATVLEGVGEGGWIRCGFSPSGRHLVIVESSGPLLFSR